MRIALVKEGKTVNLAAVESLETAPASWRATYDELVELVPGSALEAFWTSPPQWDPPAAPTEPKYRTSATLVSDERLVTSAEWAILGRVTTAIGGIVRDVTRALGALIGEVEAVGGALELQLVERDLTGAEVVLLAATVPEGFHPYVQFATAQGAIASGPCAYLLKGRLVGASSGAVRGVSLALYET